MLYGLYNEIGIFISYHNDLTITVLPQNSIALTPEQWEDRIYLRVDITTGSIIPYTPPGPDTAIIVAQKINALWQAAHDYEYQYINGSAFALLTLGVLQGKPKCIVVTAWLTSIWTLYYQRKAAVTVDSVDVDFSVCGGIPYSIQELMYEVGV